jgi:DNA-binding transcriptional LysR family regulator
VRGNLAALSFTALTAAAEAGAGITYVPDFVARPAIKRGSLIHLLKDWQSPPAPVFLAYRFGSNKIARINAVIELAKSRIPEILVGQSLA